jgi:hypothetical protein
MTKEELLRLFLGSPFYCYCLERRLSDESPLFFVSSVATKRMSIPLQRFDLCKRSVAMKRVFSEPLYSNGLIPHNII